MEKREIKELLIDWEGADGCIASNRIIYDGMWVGYCYREKPDNEYDSGWRFLAGDETDEYLDDPKNSGAYKLNTLCNFDPGIMDVLRESIGSAFGRDEEGNFFPIEEE